MFRTVWNRAVVAGNDHGRLEGDHYFRPEWLTLEYFTGSQTGVSWWNGRARYYHARAHEEINGDTAATPRGLGRRPARSPGTLGAPTG